MPASVTTATRSPRSSRASTSRDRAGLGVVVDDEQRPALDAGVLEQLAGAAGVLAGDDVGPRQRLDGPGREVAEVADGRADQHERGTAPPSPDAGADRVAVAPRRSMRPRPRSTARPRRAGRAHVVTPSSQPRTSSWSPGRRPQRASMPASPSITAGPSTGGSMRLRATG